MSSRYMFPRPMALLALGTLLAACASDPAPAPKVARAAATPTPVATPAPTEYVDSEAYLNGAVEAEKIPAAYAATTERLRVAALVQLLKDPAAQRELRQAQVCFIGVGANKKALRDPSAALLGGLRNAGLPAFRKYSECVVDGQSVREAASGTRGVLFRVCRIGYTGPGSAMVEYGFTTTGGIKGYTVMARASLEGGAWQLVEKSCAMY